MSIAPALSMTRVIRADVARVFDAWSRPELMARWLVCSREGVAHVESDLRVGGSYRVEMSSAARPIGVAYGQYLEIAAPHRLVFTWSSDSVGVLDSVVTLELRSIEGGTLISLTQSLAADSDAGRRHARGWQTSLDNLEAYFDGDRGRAPASEGAAARAPRRRTPRDPVVASSREAAIDRVLDVLLSDPVLARIVQQVRADRGGPGRGRFGTSSLRVDGKIFAMVVDERLVVKLSADRVAALVRSDDGVPYAPRAGRVMKEWVSLTTSARAVVALAREAHRRASTRARNGRRAVDGGAG